MRNPTSSTRYHLIESPPAPLPLGHEVYKVSNVLKLMVNTAIYTYCKIGQKKKPQSPSPVGAWALGLFNPSKYRGNKYFNMSKVGGTGTMI